MISGAVRTGWLSLVALLTFGLHQQIPQTIPVEQEEVFLPKPGVAKVAALGFDSVLADYYWIQAIHKIGVTDQRPAEYASYTAKIIDLVTTLDPHVDHPYRFAAIWLNDSRESVLKGNEFLERAIVYHPDDWRNYFYLGFNHFFHLGQNEEAADVLEQCIQFEGSPGYLPRLVARLRAESSDLESAIVFLNQLAGGSASDEEQAVYQGALDEIEVEQKARFLDKARAAHLKLFGDDIEEVDALVHGVHPMLERLPRPEPEELPAALRRGDRWYIDDQTGLITSSYYGRRYKLNLTRFRGVFSDKPEDGEAATSEGTI